MVDKDKGIERNVIMAVLGRTDQFSPLLQNVFNYSVEEAENFNHDYVGTEHLLLGLMREKEGVAAQIFNTLGIEARQAHNTVEHIVGRGEAPVSGDIGLTKRVKRVFEIMMKEARRQNAAEVGTEHLLIGLVKEGEGIAARVLISLGGTLGKIMPLMPGMWPEDGKTVKSLISKDNVITCRIDGRDLEAIDMLVEAGIRSTRSDAAAWLIHAGIEANKATLKKLETTVNEIRRLREEALSAIQEIEETN